MGRLPKAKPSPTPQEKTRKTSPLPFSPKTFSASIGVLRQQGIRQKDSGATGTRKLRWRPFFCLLMNEILT